MTSTPLPDPTTESGVDPDHQIETAPAAPPPDDAPLQPALDENATALDHTLRFGLETALAGNDTLYDALLHLAYKGLRVPNVNTKLTGTFSYTGVSAFLSVIGGFVLSPTAQSVGIVGSLNLVGIPVGKLRGFFVSVTNPFLCGDVTLALGPRDLGHLRLTFSAGFDVLAFTTSFLPLAGSVAAPTLRGALQITAPVALIAGGDDPAAALAHVPPEQLIALLGALMQSDTTPEVKTLPGDLFTLVWDQFDPQLLICGSVQPRIFGLALGEEVVGISANADKLSFSASFRASASAILSYCRYTILPPFDKMEFGFNLALPDPSGLIADGFAVKASLGDIGAFAKDLVTLLGIPLGNASIALLPPDDGAPGLFEIKAAVPKGSWVQQ